MTGFTMDEILGDDDRRDGSAYAGLRAEESAAVMARLQRNWQRHPELRAEHGGSFERYRRAETYRFS